MSHSQYASLRAQLPALTVAAVSGGSLAGSGTVEICYQGRNRAGWNLPTSLQSVSYTAGQRIAITIPNTARAAGEDIHEYVISIAQTSATPSSIRQVAIYQAYDADQVTPRALPTTLYLSQPAHLVVGTSQQVANLAALPTGTSLINGMVREVLNIGDSTSRILEYRSESTATVNGNTVFSAATGRWVRIFGFTTYLTDTLASGGCDRALKDLDLTKVIQAPPYVVDGSLGTYVRYWFFGSRNASAPATSQGLRVGLQVFDSGLDRSASYDGLLKYIFTGYANPADGTLDTSGMTVGAQQTYLFGKNGALVLEKDLPAGQAAEFKVAPSFGLAEQSTLAQGGTVSIDLRGYTQAGSANPLSGFFGNAVSPEGDRLRVVPDGSSVRVLGGAASVGTLQFPVISAQPVTGLLSNTADQYIHLNGNGVAYVDDGNPGQQEAIRAKVSTASGRSSAGVASSYAAVASGDTLSVTVTHGRAVRANYPEPSGATSVIAGNSQGTFTPPQLAVYLERESDGELWEYLFSVTDTATQLVTISSLASAASMPASIPTAPAANFSLFGPGAASFTSPSGSSDFTAGNYRVSFAYVYSGSQVTVIQHEAEAPTEDWLKELAAPLTDFGVGGGAVTDGDKGDITVSSSGSFWMLNETTVTPGTYSSANIEVDAQGRIIDASDGSGGGGGVGGFGIFYTYAANNSAPPSGQIRATSGGLLTTPTLRASFTGDDGPADGRLETIKEGTYLQLSLASDPTNFAVFIVGSVTNSGTFFTYDVTLTDSGGTIPGGSLVWLAIAAIPQPGVVLSGYGDPNVNSEPWVQGATFFDTYINRAFVANPDDSDWLPLGCKNFTGNENYPPEALYEGDLWLDTTGAISVYSNGNWLTVGSEDAPVL